MYPHERSLVKRLSDQPFAIVGVNSDADRSMIQKVVQEENLTWRSFWNGPKGPDGPISNAWNVEGWPTVYLLDAEGRIRRRWIGGPPEKDLDQAIEELLQEIRDQEG